ncbi:hypothetical protein Arno162_82 [Pectobacterium phage Arno162]|uniref:Uncharacterized protein n=1 Tax=Pectobacterium phage Arno162 TaxID=2500577 RepID=A0A678ZRJ5_9CAUD|nr:hypothetical protein Arno162_82 [Pectobacterium phage Arno162]
MVKMVKKPARERLEVFVKGLVQNSVKVGYFDDQGKHHSGMTYPTLMYLQEVHGVRSKDGLVRRQAFGKTMQLSSGDILNKTHLSLLRSLRQLKNPDAALNTFGKEAQDAIKETFGNTALLKSNAPATIKKKGFNSPLIETSELRDRLTYRVGKRGK